MSKIEVDAITEQSGSTLTAGGGAGKTVVVDATTVTLGRCGGTVALASGASQTGFGRTGTVDWITTPKTATFSAVSGEGYFCNTSGGAFTVNLPAGSAGAIVSLADYAGTFQTNNLTVSPNGSEKIGGSTIDVKLSTEGQSVTLVYVDSTQGWVTTADSTENVVGESFIVATGGTITQSGNCKIHTFTGPGTFTVSTAAVCSANNAVAYLIIGGGGGAGGGAGSSASGAGAGGFREGRNNPITPYTASPLVTTGITVTETAFPIVVGGGGSGTQCCGSTPTNKSPGNVSSALGLTAAAGGSGNSGGNPTAGNPGGSGGGGSGNNPPAAAGSGNTPPVSPSQGSNGGDAVPSLGPGIRAGGGGGGAGGVGGQGQSPNVAGAGGVGVTSSITGSSLSYAGGGGGSNQTGAGSGGAGSPCGTGGTGRLIPTNPSAGGSGTTNRGGGGGAGVGAAGGSGGSGIVVIRYKFQ